MMRRVGAGRVILAIAVGGLVAAAAEMAIILPVQQRLGVPPIRVFQFIASGALGAAAFRDRYSVAVGIAAHLFISLVAAAIYVLAGLRWPALLRRPVGGGAIFGALAFVVMTFAVLPLTAIGFQPPKSLALGAMSLATHVVGFGVPLALAAAACLRPGRQVPMPSTSSTL
jgi:uncharacterized membrane protein YagU involved in acid resistance